VNQNSQYKTAPFQWEGMTINITSGAREVLLALFAPDPPVVTEIKMQYFNLKFEEPYYQPQKLLEMSDLKKPNLVQQKYLGTKEVMAWPMTRGAYNTYRGWDIPENEDKNEEGYLVEYLDSPNKNHDAHDNYISWSPKDVFDRSYKNISDFKSRLVQEKSEVSDRISKLEPFINSENFAKIDVRQQELLKVQLHTMKSYEWVLNQRINLL
jgi:hypothetical protein